MKHVLARTLLVTLASLSLSCSQEPVGFSPTSETLTWRTIASFGSPDYINDVWGTAPDDLYATIDRGSGSTGSPLIHFDGTAWTEVPLPSGTTRLGEIKGTSAADIWAAGGGGLLHYDGATWTNTGVGGYRVALTQVGEVYAIATSAGYDNAVVRFDGASWDTLHQLTAREYGRAVWASDEPALVVAVSNYPGDSLLWWDGVATRKVQAPGRVWSFWGGSSADLLAAGNTGPNGDGVIWRWDGSNWISMTIPPGTDHVNDIDGVAPSDLYAVSGRGALIHFDGAAWQTSPIPTDRDLSRVLALPSDLYVALGGSTLMHRANGNWNTLLGDGPYDIDLVWAESAQRMVALAGDFTVWEWNSGVWTERGSGGQDFYGPQALAGRAIDDLYAVTDRDGILHYDGFTWSVDNDTIPYVEALAVSPSGTVFASRHDAIYRRDAAGWTRIFLDDRASLSSLWVGDGDEVFAGGFGLVHLKGTTVEMNLEIHSTFDAIRGISGVSSREVYFARERGLLLYDGGGLRPVGPAGLYGGVIAAPDGTVLALGYFQHALFSDNYWRAVPRTQASVNEQLINARDGTIIRLSARARTQRISYLDE